MSNGSNKDDSTTIHKPLKERYLKFSDPFNPFYIDIGDNLTVTLVLDLLTTNNFVSWSWAISHALHAKNKLVLSVALFQNLSMQFILLLKPGNDAMILWYLGSKIH